MKFETKVVSLTFMDGKTKDVEVGKSDVVQPTGMNGITISAYNPATGINKTAYGFFNLASYEITTKSKECKCDD